MNNEQLQDWLTTIADKFKQFEERTEPSKGAIQYQKKLAEISPETSILINYLTNNYENIGLIQPIVAQLLSIYYKLGIGRAFVLQLVPSLISTYLLGIAKRQKLSIAMLETFFMAIYNEEILAGGPGSQQMNKKVEEVRIPSVRYPSVYHDPSKLNPYQEISTLRLGGGASVHNVVKIGPYPAVDKITAENRPLVLSVIVRAVNNLLCRMSRNIVCHSYCLSFLILAKSGFNWPESDFRLKILHDRASDDEYGDHSKKPRIPMSPFVLIEALNGIHYALFNGYPDIALRALDAIHHRAQFEFYADVMLVTNALRSSLMDPDTIRMMLEIEPPVAKKPNSPMSPSNNHALK
uniref:PH domain-containing protein n=1 Tax=Panagrellus redivivus TaxID=6233 RepID=A0A7E4VQ87_PANRE